MKYIGLFSVILLMVLPFFMLFTVFLKNKSFWNGSITLSIFIFIASSVQLMHYRLFANDTQIPSENAAEFFLISVLRNGITVFVYPAAFLLSLVFVWLYKKRHIK